MVETAVQPASSSNTANSMFWLLKSQRTKAVHWLAIQQQAADLRQLRVTHLPLRMYKQELA